MLDKGRAEIADQSGEYHYNCPLDQRFVNFVGIDPTALARRTRRRQGRRRDSCLDQRDRAAQTAHPWEIEQWSDYMQRRGPDSDAESREYFAEMLDKISQTREDIKTWADLLDLDDYVTFGGKA